MTEESERRLFSRFMFDAETTIRQGGHVWQVKLLDISLNCLLIAQPDDWAIDITAPLAVTITLDDSVEITMMVRWRHTDNGCIGFECEHIDLDSIGHLRRLVELNLGDSSLLQRELAALGA